MRLLFALLTAIVSHSLAVPASTALGGIAAASNAFQCDSGWTYFENTEHCYKLFQGEDIWQAYEGKCQLHGAHLTSVNSEEEQAFIRELSATGTNMPECIPTGCLAGVWLGLVVESNLTAMKWTDGSVVNYTNWMPGAPRFYSVPSYTLYYPDYFHPGATNLAALHWVNNPPPVVLGRAGVCKKPIV